MKDNIDETYCADAQIDQHQELVEWDVDRSLEKISVVSSDCIDRGSYLWLDVRVKPSAESFAWSSAYSYPNRWSRFWLIQDPHLNLKMVKEIGGHQRTLFITFSMWSLFVGLRERIVVDFICKLLTTYKRDIVKHTDLSIPLVLLKTPFKTCSNAVHWDLI